MATLEARVPSRAAAASGTDRGVVDWTLGD